MDRRTFVKNLGLGAVAAAVTLLSQLSKQPIQLLPQVALVHLMKWLLLVAASAAPPLQSISRCGGEVHVKVTLVDINSNHISCILSNLVLNGQKTLGNLTFNLTNSAGKHNFSFKQGAVSSLGQEINGSRYIVLANGDKVNFDKLVLAPGIDFVYPGDMIKAEWTDTNTPFPHAWKAGLQTNNLRDQLKRLPTGGKARVVMTIPGKPYRCPPGPYERACLIADYLKTKKGGGKLYVVDANPSIQAEPLNFGKAFNELYKGIIEYQPNAVVNSVSAVNAFNPNVTLPQDKTINITYGTSTTNYPLSAPQKFHLINVIPNHKAADMLFKNGFEHLLNGKNWAGVHLDTYKSLYDNDIYVIGDAHDSIQPKAGHIANSEAKVCADALLRDVGLRTARVMPDEAPVTNSACFSPITATTASFLTTGFRYDQTSDSLDKIEEASGEAEQINSDNYKMMLAWANNLFTEVF